MYLSSEDFYLYCYSIFVILDSLDCTGEKYFRDYRKLAFLTDIISDKKIVYVISNTDNQVLNPRDYECLLDSYSDGLTRRSEILKLLFVLEKLEYVVLQRGSSQEINVSLRKDKLPDNFLEKQVFASEYQNSKFISKKVGRLASLKLDTMLKKIYTDNGVKTWG